jgi:hypothetical protein
MARKGAMMTTSDVNAYRLGLAFSAALAAGCAVDVPTNANTFSIEPTSAAHLSGAQPVALKNGYKEAAAVREIGAGKGQTWRVDQKQLTDTAIAMLTRAVEQHGVKTSAQAEKSVTLLVRATHGFIQTRAFSPVAQSNASVVLEVEFGDGTQAFIRADNNSPMGVQRAFDGAVLFALNKLLVHEKFVTYVRPNGASPLK